MNVEQRLLQAFDEVDRMEMSPDLWSRVVHSIDEDRQFRRRTRRSLAVVLAATAGFVVATVASMSDGVGGRQIGWESLEIIETSLLVVLALVLAPAIRSFGRGYAADLWPSQPETGHALLRLLDVAYGLLTVGFILVTARFEPDLQSAHVVSGQIADTAHRVGGLVLMVGLLHAVTIMLLPLVALVSNSTRTGQRLPRWVTVILVLLGLGIGFFLTNVLGFIVTVGSS